MSDVNGPVTVRDPIAAEQVIASSRRLELLHLASMVALTLAIGIQSFYAYQTAKAFNERLRQVERTLFDGP